MNPGTILRSDFRTWTGIVLSSRKNWLGMFLMHFGRGRCPVVNINGICRTFSFILLLDTAFVIFNNTPPKLSIAELSMAPVCPERSFQAQSAEECFLHLARSYTTSIPSSKEYSVASTVTKMCQNVLGTDNREYFARLGKMNLFIVISGMLQTSTGRQSSAGLLQL